MEYSLTQDGMRNNMSSWSLKGFEDFSAESICRSRDFVARHLVTPAVEATLNLFLKNCTPESEPLLAPDWSLCTPNHDFDCKSILMYTSQCKAYRESSSCIHSTTTVKSTSMDDLMNDTSGVLILVGLVLIGILLGVASTIAVCLFWPQTHRWANSKLRNTDANEKKMRQSVTSDYYTAIDNNIALQIRPPPLPHTPISNSSSSGDGNKPLMRLSANRDFDDTNYIDSSTRETHRSYIGIQPGTSEEFPELNEADETYEPLSRNNTHNQSHNYAHIDQRSPCSPTSEHSYFVLEKRT